MSQRTTVFVSYSRKNRRWLDRLKVHLTPYDRRGVLVVWDDSKIEPGDRWHAEINAAIDRAAVSVMLISADFLASDFVASHELPRLLQKAKRAGARILPVFVEPCELTNHPELASFQGVNTPAKPLAQMSRVEAERVLVRAAETIGQLLGSPRLPPTEDADAHTAAVGAAAADLNLFDELQSATIALSLMSALANTRSDFTLSELEKLLAIRSRKKAYQALSRLTAAGWVEKVRVSASTKYHLTNEGARQLQRLIDGSTPFFRPETDGDP
jgi:hypothetical protein